MAAPSVSANGKSIVTENSKGKAMATIPDVCLLPMPTGGPIPLPLPNIAESKDLEMGSVMTKIDGGSIATFGSSCSKSKGDKVGTQGGIISGSTEGKAYFLGCSPDVMVEMRPVSRKGDLLIMNTINTVGLTGMNQKDVKEAEEGEEKTLKIELKDAEGNPMVNEPYKVSHSGKVVAEGNLDSLGKATIEGVDGVLCKVTFKDQKSVKKTR